MRLKEFVQQELSARWKALSNQDRVLNSLSYLGRVRSPQWVLATKVEILIEVLDGSGFQVVDE